MKQEKHPGIEALRGAVETVASDLEGRTRWSLPARRVRPLLLGGLALAGSAAAVAALLWLARPHPAAEVQILELKIHGRPVRGVVVDDRASGSLVVMPQAPGPPRAALCPPGGTP